MLCRETFERLLGWLDSDRAAAAERYSNLHLKLIRFFEWNSADFPEGCADETMDIVARKVNEEHVVCDQHGEEIRNKVGFVLGVGRNVLRTRRRTEEGRHDPLPDDYPAIEGGDWEQACREECIQKIEQSHGGQWQLLCDYYGSGRGIDERCRNKIAKRLKISRNALTIKICRIKDDLWPEFRNCMRECLQKFNFF